MLREEVKQKLKECDLILHAGDICSPAIYDALERFRLPVTMAMVEASAELDAKNAGITVRRIDIKEEKAKAETREISPGVTVDGILGKMGL